MRDLEIRRTICPATRERQEEAVQLAKRADVMLVVGGRESSNSRKLFEPVSYTHLKERWGRPRWQKRG